LFKKGETPILAMKRALAKVQKKNEKREVGKKKTSTSQCHPPKEPARCGEREGKA